MRAGHAHAESSVITPAFLFATGVENSNPTIHNGRVRVDEMAKCGHYTRWRDDFDCVQQLGVRFLRYGPPLYRTHLGSDRYDWAFVDETFTELYRRGLTPIVDLCHFGGASTARCMSSSWITG